MFKFDKSDVQRVAASMIGALILTSVMVGSAVGPARAVETAPIASLGTQVAAEAHA